MNCQNWKKNYIARPALFYYDGTQTCALRASNRNFSGLLHLTELNSLLLEEYIIAPCWKDLKSFYSKISNQEHGSALKV